MASSEYSSTDVLLREFTHRVKNEFASAIHVVSFAAEKSRDRNVKAAHVPRAAEQRARGVAVQSGPGRPPARQHPPDRPRRPHKTRPPPPPPTPPRPRGVRGSHSLFRHGRARPGHPRLSCSYAARTW